jgi:hypothetical protein
MGDHLPPFLITDFCYARGKGSGAARVSVPQDVGGCPPALLSRLLAPVRHANSSFIFVHTATPPGNKN